MNEEQQRTVEEMRAYLPKWDYDPATRAQVEALLTIIDAQQAALARQQAMIDAAGELHARYDKDRRYLINGTPEWYALEDALDALKTDKR